MKKIILSGKDESKIAVINAIKAIGNDDHTVIVKSFDIEIDLLNKLYDKNDELFIYWRGNPEHKLQLVKSIKELTGAGLKTVKDTVDDFCRKYPVSQTFPILEFIEEFGLSMSEETLYKACSEDEFSITNFIEIHVK